MIRRRTAFIMGAGTSVPYGFPSGAGLMREAQRLNQDNLTFKLYGSAPADVALLLDALQRSYDSSLDALLELRADITPIGKRLMASLLLEIEYHSLARALPEDHWLGLFFQELTTGTRSLEDFARNPITIITYNYDRLLEYRLVRALSAHYGRPDKDCIATLKQIPIIHLHGDLGPLPGFAESGTVPFGPSPQGNPEIFIKSIGLASERIIIVHEARPETDEFERAREALRTADQVVMLGFGYGATNLARLEINRWKRDIDVLGTVYGLTLSRINYDVQKAFIAARNRGISVGSAQQRVRDFLDNALQIFRE